MGFGSRLKKSVKYVAKNPAKSMKNSSEWLAKSSTLNVNDQTSNIRNTLRTGTGNAVTGYKEGSKEAHQAAVAKKKAAAAAAAEEVRKKQQIKDDRIARYKAEVDRERAKGPAYVDSLQRMRQQATPEGVAGPRYGDINRRMASGAPTENHGMMTRSGANPYLGSARQMRERMDSPSGVYSGPGIPRNSSVAIQANRVPAGTGAGGSFFRKRGLTSNRAAIPVNQQQPITAGQGLTYRNNPSSQLGHSQQPTATAGQGLTYTGDRASQLG
jgi:hypothetical protein